MIKIIQTIKLKMEKIREIRQKVISNYSYKNDIDMELWKCVEDNIVLSLAKAKLEGHKSKIKFEEKIALEKEGFIIIRGLTLEEWQKYFCDIVDNITKNISNIKILSSNHITDFFEKYEYNKLITVLAYSKKYNFTQEQLLDRKYIFPKSN